MGHVREASKSKLQRFQTRAARVISGANYDTHSVDLFNTLSWDTLENRRTGAKSVLMYKTLNDHTAPGLRGSFVRREIDQTNYHLRNTATDLSLPKPKREFLKKSFKYSGAMLWNQLPVEGKIAESLQPFKSVVTLDDDMSSLIVCSIYYLLFYICNLCVSVFS